MKKVTLQYDESTGFLTDAQGQLVGTFYGVISFESESKVIPPADLVELAKAGFNAEELLEMKKKGLL